MRAVLDANVLISSLLAPAGAPARLLRAWALGAFELIVSPALLGELERALDYPKLRRRVPPAEAGEFVELLRQYAELRDDPTEKPELRSEDPGDDYLISLAEASQAVIVSGDRHLLDLEKTLPAYRPSSFLPMIGTLPEVSQ